MNECFIILFCFSVLVGFSHLFIFVHFLAVFQSMAQKEDQEERIATLEKRYLAAQRESTASADANDKLQAELALKTNQLKVVRQSLRESRDLLAIWDDQKSLRSFALAGYRVFWKLFTWENMYISFRLELISRRGGISHSDPSSPLPSVTSTFFL